MVSRLFIIFSLFLLSCHEQESDRNLLKVNKENILHDNGAKIWLINKVLKKGVNHSKLELDEKDVAIFFESGRVNFQPISTLGNYPKKFGTSYLSDDSKSLFINFQDEKWYFIIKEINSKKVILKHTAESDFKYDLELISYPEGN